MKKSLLSIIVILCCGLAFSGCNKDANLTLDPSMTATIGTYVFKADYIEPSTLKSQINDTGTALFITGYEKSSGDKIIVSVTKYTGNPGTFSIVQGQASASYFHNGVWNVASGGIVAIKDASGNNVSGYFNFTTTTGLSITNATYVCGKPWDY